MIMIPACGLLVERVDLLLREAGVSEVKYLVGTARDVPDGDLIAYAVSVLERCAG